METDVEGALERGGRSGECQGRGCRAFGGEAEFGEMGDDFGDVGGVGAEALIELLRSQKLMEFRVAGRVDGGEKFLGFVAVAETKCNGDGEWSLRAECSTIDRFGSITSRKG